MEQGSTPVLDNVLIIEEKSREPVSACCHSFETNRGRCFDCPCSTLRAGDDEDDFFDTDDDVEEE